ncbi:MAG: YgjV family protein [Salinivirgaceae bacterium]|nr:YgjV family protein [Salinivirgaceae bacterium]
MEWLDLSFWSIIGYLASVLVLVSMLMKSVLKLRIFNVIGSFVFVVYGIAIGAYPVALLNFATAIVNIVQVIKLCRTKSDKIEIVPVMNNDPMLLSFLNHYKSDIRSHFPNFKLDKDETEMLSFFVLRDMVVSGVFIAHTYNAGSLFIDLDYVTPQYRDMRSGKHIFRDQLPMFIERGFNRIYTYAGSKGHVRYLKNMGFEAHKSMTGTRFYILDVKKEHENVQQKVKA